MTEFRVIDDDEGHIYVESSNGDYIETFLTTEDARNWVRERDWRLKLAAALRESDWELVADLAKSSKRELIQLLEGSADASWPY